MDKIQELKRIFDIIIKETVTFVVGMEKEGERFYVKSQYAATLIGFLYRKALQEERPEILDNKFLPFPEFDQHSPQVKVNDQQRAGALR